MDDKQKGNERVMELKSERIELKARPEEKQGMIALAKSKGLTLSAYILSLAYADGLKSKLPIKEESKGNRI